MTKIKVILANEQRTQMMELAAAMEKTGHFEVVGTAISGSQTLALVDACQPDLLLIDLVLPEMDGALVLERLHKQRKMPSTIVLTSFAGTCAESTCAALGVEVFMRKPITPSLVCERLLLWKKTRKLCTDTSLTALGDMRFVKKAVTRLLHSLGMPAHIKGHQYLREAICLRIELGEQASAVTKVLYPAVAKRCKTTSIRVERSIRHAIELTWLRGDIEVLQQFFSHTISIDKGKPTNNEFISMLSDHICLDLQVG